MQKKKFYDNLLAAWKDCKEEINNDIKDLENNKAQAVLKLIIVKRLIYLKQQLKQLKNLAIIMPKEHYNQQKQEPI